MYQDPGERSSGPIRHAARCACECPEVLWKCQSTVACHRIRGTAYNSPGSFSLLAYVLLKEITITTFTTNTVWPQAKLQRGNTAPPITESWIKDVLSTVLTTRARPSFPHSQSLPSRSFCKALILIHQTKTEWKPQSQKLTKLITWITALSNSMKL